MSEQSVAPIYEWDIEVHRLNHYGDRVEKRIPTKILAATRSEVTQKVRVMFDATYDDFRKFWSHTWALNSVREVTSPLEDGGGAL
jgi:hypothetical protein